jgi:predicted DsbA family dithiol-disulfide isomerase
MEPMVVDVWADVACPWCWMGRRRLQVALDAEPAGSVVVRHRAFELQPDLPPGGLPAADFYARKFGSPEQLLETFTAVAESGAQDGLGFAFDRMQRAPNTRLAHRLVKLAGAHGPAHEGEALEALFAAHFTQGADLSDRAQAIAIVREATGLDFPGLEGLVEQGAGLDEVLADEHTAAELGVQGVPFFLAGGAVAVSGAHDPETMARLLAAAREKLAAAS